MDWTQPSIIISLIALAVSMTSLGWNIIIKIRENASRIDYTATVTCFADEKIPNSCTVSVTNIGQRPVTIRKIILHEKKDKKILPFYTTYRDYSKDVENKPIISGEWRHIVLLEHKQFPFYDTANANYKLLRATIVDSKKKEWKTPWFRQSYHP